MKKQSSNVRSAAARILKGLLRHSAWERGTHLPDQVVLQEPAPPVFKKIKSGLDKKRMRF